MQCPVDGTALMMTERSGVEIDYCPKCRGVWLDRGELDKIVERAAPPVLPVALQEPGRAAPRPAAPGYRPTDDPRRPREDDRHRQDDDRRGQDGDYDKRKKRGGFLDELFDF